MIWYQRLCSPASRRYGERLSVDEPMDTVTTVGVGGAGAGGGDWHWIRDGRPEAGPMIDPRKPPYRVPSMDEIRAVPWNGFEAISTFSGCGGSSLGLRMAGFRVLWASEFVEAARASYAANKSPNTILDGRDIRQVMPEDVLATVGRSPGEIDLLEGSPPCASFSTAGKREKHWGQTKAYSDRSQRTDDLFFEFARLLRGIRPKTFIAENVSGLVKGTAKGYFLEILAELKSCGYRVEARLLDAQWLGVPQARQRLIFVGVRSDLGLAPAFPKPLPYRYSVRDALPWIGGITYRNGNPDYRGGTTRKPGSEPAPTVTAAGLGAGAYHAEEIVAVGGNGPYGTSRWGSPDGPARTIGASPSTGNGRAGGGDVLVRRVELEAAIPPEERRPGVRVIYDSGYRRDPLDISDRPSPTVTIGSGGGAPNASPFKVEAEADIARYAIGAEWERMGRPGTQSDKYFQLVRPALDAPCSTVTGNGARLGLASVVHPTEKRKFSIAELKRICGFPDTFELAGSYAQRWERLGRAVPPVMMFWIASAIRDKILLRDTPA